MVKVVFFGTPAFAVPTLQALLASHHQVVGVVTQPDRPRGRGQKTSDAPVKASAVAAGLPVLQPARMKDPEFLTALGTLGAEIGVVAAYGRILTQAILDIPPLGMVNVHASLLPRYRGAAPIHRAVMAGDTETGVTIMRVVQALDAGPMLATVRRPIGPDETSQDVEHDLARLGGNLLVDTLDGVGHIPEVEQDDAQATYASRLTKDDGAIDWTWPAEQVHNAIRGLHPWPHAFTFLGTDRVILLRSRRVSFGANVRLKPDATFPDGEPGTIVSVDDGLDVATGAGVVRILELQSEGRRPVTSREFVAGHRLPPGARFTPAP